MVERELASITKHQDSEDGILVLHNIYQTFSTMLCKLTTFTFFPDKEQLIIYASNNQIIFSALGNRLISCHSYNVRRILAMLLQRASAFLQINK